MKFILFSATLLTILFSYNISITHADEGETLPHPLTSVDQNGKAQDFESIKGPAGAILVFIRSADWCPYCQKQLLTLNSSYEDIRKTGYDLVSISYDSVEALQKFHGKHNIKFKMLSDQNSKIIKDFGILNESVNPQSSSYGIPNPAIYIVTEEGVIEAILKEDGYKSRPTIEQILQQIRQLKSQKDP